MKTRTYRVRIDWHEIDTHVGENPPPDLGWNPGIRTTITDEDFGGQLSGLASRKHRIGDGLEYDRRDVDEITIRALIGAAGTRLNRVIKECECADKDQEGKSNAQTHLLWHLSDAASWVKDAVTCWDNNYNSTY